MRQKLIAILILLIMLGIPALWYWFFFIKNVSSVEIFLKEWMQAKVSLQWSFSYGWLPLADRVLDFQKDCETSCVFGPISPANYTLTISADGFSSWQENFVLKNGEKISKNIELTRMTTFSKVELSSPLSSDEKILRTDDVREILGSQFSVIDRDSRGRLLLVKTENASTSFGIFRDNNFLKIIDFPYHFSEISFDYYHDIVIFRTNSGAILMTIDTENILETSLPEGVISVFFVDNFWYAITAEKTLFYKNGEWQENPRFTHFIDLDGTWRAGFIAENDDNRLKIGNYKKEEWSAMMLLNRKNGDIFDLGRGFSLKRFLRFQDQIFAESEYWFYNIVIPK